MKRKVLSGLCCAALCLVCFSMRVSAEPAVPGVQQSGQGVTTASEPNGIPVSSQPNGTPQPQQTDTATDGLLEKSSMPVASPAVAMIGDRGYETLEEAFEAAVVSGASETVIEITADSTVTQKMTIPSGVHVTLTSDGEYEVLSDMPSKEVSAILVEEGGRLTIDGEGLTIKSEEKNEDVAALVSCKGTFILENGTLDFNGNSNNISYGSSGVGGGIVTVWGGTFVMNGGTVKNAKPSGSSGGIRVASGGRFEMNGGTITEINTGGNLYAGAVLVYSDDSSLFGIGPADFVMNGGVIEGNQGYRGAGVCVVGVIWNYQATMRMTGGVIQNNVCNGWVSNSVFQAAGGGIYAQTNASVILEGGVIRGNKVDGGLGGGIALLDAYPYAGVGSDSGTDIDTWSQYYPCELIMTGGTIEDNEAYSFSAESGHFGDAGCGGGIYLASNKVKLYGGVIKDNYAEKQGGGVYVGSIPYTLQLRDAVVTDNDAELLGGGIWACPTGDVEQYITNGGAVYGNRAAEGGAGDDVVSVKRSNVNYQLTLADRLLGGGQVLWYEDGAIAPDDDTSLLGNPDPNVPRYGENHMVQVIDVKSKAESYALKAVVSETAAALANESAKLWITGNRSLRGGGIGTNGAIVLGEKDLDFSLTVRKKWENGSETDRKPITVFLKVGEFRLDSVTLNEENNWTGVFQELPDPQSLNGGLSYAAVEDPVPEHFRPVYSEVVYDADTRTMEIEVTNIYSPDDEEPEKPDKPGGGDDPRPDRPGTPDGPGVTPEPPEPVTPERQLDPVPKTGENMIKGMWRLVMAVSVCGMAVCAGRSRRRR